MRRRWSLAVVPLLLAAQQRDLKLDRPSGAAMDGRGRVWAVVVGISRYDHVPDKAQLRFADRDARAFADFLRSPAGGGVPAEQVKLLVEENATLAKVRTALGTWLARSSEANDIVYIYFAGHGVIDSNEGYLIARDSDPQNLYATALPVTELDRIVTSRVRARHVVLIADACHAGSIGWVSRGAEDKLAINRLLEEAARTGPSTVKLLASRPDERSYEDERWGGGHGAFTFSLLEGLGGKADRDGDGLVRADEIVSFVSTTVPQQTQDLQHPRVAGSLEARLPLAIVAGVSAATPPAPTPATAAPAAKKTATVAKAPELPAVEITGPPGSQIYVDNVPRGRIRPGGVLILTDEEPGLHEVSIDLPDGSTSAQRVTIGAGKQTVAFQAARPADPAPLRKIAEEADTIAALEAAGQQGITDYVTSTAPGLKHGLLRRAVDAFRKLQSLRPTDRELQSKRAFVEGRLLIAEGKAKEAIPLLDQAMQLDPHTACPYNALGVAYERTGDNARAAQLYQKAAERAPAWSLPHLQLGMLHQKEGRTDAAAREFAMAVSFNPRAVMPRWLLVRALRMTGKNQEAIQAAAELLRMNENYAPVYIEIARIYESVKQFDKAAEAYDLYLQLAPNFSDSDQVRAQAAKARQSANPRPAPTLKR